MQNDDQNLLEKMCVEKIEVANVGMGFSIRRIEIVFEWFFFSIFCTLIPLNLCSISILW